MAQLVLLEMRDLAATLGSCCSVLNIGREDWRWCEPPPLREAGSAPDHGRWGSLQLPRLLGQPHDFIWDVTRENAPSEVALAAR